MSESVPHARAGGVEPRRAVDVAAVSPAHGRKREPVPAGVSDDHGGPHGDKWPTLSGTSFQVIHTRKFLEFAL